MKLLPESGKTGEGYDQYTDTGCNPTVANGHIFPKKMSKISDQKNKYIPEMHSSFTSLTHELKQLDTSHLSFKNFWFNEKFFHISCI